MVSLFLLAQSNTTAFSGGVLGLLSDLGPVGIAILVLLGIFSLLSWAIIIYKGIACTVRTRSPRPSCRSSARATSSPR